MTADQVVSTGSDLKPGEQRETWVYIGLRTSDGKRVHAWRDPAGKKLYYGGRETYVTGGYYTVIVERDGSAVRRGHPVYLSKQISDADELRELFAASKRTEHKLAAEAAERKAKGVNPFDELIDPLVAAARKLPTQAQKDVLITHVLRRLYAAW